MLEFCTVVISVTTCDTLKNISFGMIALSYLKKHSTSLSLKQSLNCGMTDEKEANGTHSGLQLVSRSSLGLFKALRGLCRYTKHTIRKHIIMRCLCHQFARLLYRIVFYYIKGDGNVQIGFASILAHLDADQLEVGFSN